MHRGGGMAEDFSLKSYGNFLFGIVTGMAITSSVALHYMDKAQSAAAPDFNMQAMKEFSAQGYVYDPYFSDLLTQDQSQGAVLREQQQVPEGTPQATYSYTPYASDLSVKIFHF